MCICVVLSNQISIVLRDPVPQQAKDEPAPCERCHEKEENKSPADLYEGGPEVQQVGEVAPVLDVTILNVAASVFVDQTGFAVTTSLQQPEHPGAEEQT